MAAIQYGGATTDERRQTIEDRIGASKLVHLFDDDGDGAIAGDDLARLERYFAMADDVVTGLLIGKGWTEQQLRDSMRQDRQVINAWSGILAQLAGERKSEWLDQNGKGPFDAYGTRARSELGQLARGELRSHRESGEGGTPNATLGAEVGEHRFEFAPDPNIPYDRGKGSF